MIYEFIITAQPIANFDNPLRPQPAPNKAGFGAGGLNINANSSHACNSLRAFSSESSIPAL